MNKVHEYELFSVYEIGHAVVGWVLGLQIQKVFSYPNDFFLPHTRLTTKLDYSKDALFDVIAFFLSGGLALKCWGANDDDVWKSPPLTACLKKEKQEMDVFFRFKSIKNEEAEMLIAEIAPRIQDILNRTHQEPFQLLVEELRMKGSLTLLEISKTLEGFEKNNNRVQII